MFTLFQKRKLEELRINCSISELKRILDRAIPKFLNGSLNAVKYGENLILAKNKIFRANRKANLWEAFADGLSVEEIQDFDYYKTVIENVFLGNEIIETEVSKYVKEIKVVIFGDDSEIELEEF